jgi:hypothetical protein
MDRVYQGITFAPFCVCTWTHVRIIERASESYGATCDEVFGYLEQSSAPRRVIVANITAHLTPHLPSLATCHRSGLNAMEDVELEKLAANVAHVPTRIRWRCSSCVLCDLPEHAGREAALVQDAADQIGGR